MDVAPPAAVNEDGPHASLNAFIDATMQANDDIMCQIMHCQYDGDNGGVGVPVMGLLPQTAFRKQRTKVIARCNACGAFGRTIKNCGGATRETMNTSAKYKMYCQPELNGCGRRFLMSRDPNADGSYTQTDSTFAIDDETKRSTYRCGKCGQIKKGHTCAMADDEPMAKRSKHLQADLGNLLDDEDNCALPSLLRAIQSVERPVEVEVPDEGAVDADAGSAAQLPIGSLPTPTGAEEADDPVVIPNDGAEREERDEAEDELAATNHLLAAEEVGVASGMTPTLLTIASHSLMQAASHPKNGSVVISLLNLVRYHVKGDGSCWVYAMLACAGLCESRHVEREQQPTPRDRGMDRWCRSLAFLWMYEHQNRLQPDEIETLSDVVDVVPQHPLVDNDDFGSYGTITTIAGLAAYFDVSVVCWNKTTLRIPNARQQVLLHKHDDRAPFDISEVVMSPSEILALSRSDARVMHLEWNGVDHYAALVGQTPTPINAAQMAGLMSSTPVSAVNPKSLKPLKPPTKKMPDAPGWMHLVDKWRTDITLERVSSKSKSLKQLLQLTRSKKYHGIVFYTVTKRTEVCFCTFAADAKLSATDFMFTGDFACNMYIDEEWQRHCHGAAQADVCRNDCACLTYFNQPNDLIQCCQCNAWSHAICAGVILGELDDPDAFVCSHCVAK